MEVVNFNISTSLVEAVRLVKAKSYRMNTRVVAEFNDFILDSNKSEDDNIKDYKAQFNKNYVDGVDWEQRRYEIAKEIIYFGLGFHPLDGVVQEVNRQRDNVIIGH